MNKEGLRTHWCGATCTGWGLMFVQGSGFKLLLGFKAQGTEAEVFRVLGVQGFPCHEGVP